MKTKSLTFNENRQIFVTDSNKNVVSLLSIKFWDLLKIIQAVGKFYENLERVFSFTKFNLDWWSNNPECGVDSSNKVIAI